MAARPLSFAAGLLASLVGLYLAVDPRFWSSSVEWFGVALVVVGGALAVGAGLRRGRPLTRIAKVLVALVPAAVLLAFILLLLLKGGA